MPSNNTQAIDISPDSQRARRGLAEFATQHAVRRQRRVWSGRVAAWDRHGSAGMTKVTSAVLDASGVRPGDRVVDLGCGTGQISLPLAARGAQVLAVDVSAVMVRQLMAEADSRGVQLDAVALPIEELRLPAGSIDLVVSSYALHHLRDPDKLRLVSAAAGWLRPGGRLVLADMMLGRGSSARDRAIIKSKLGVLARRGPGGWWRIAKNAVRYQLRLHERPVSMDRWIAMLAGCGFGKITGADIVAEAGLVTAERTGEQAA